jgi:hypothetical protein
MNDELTMHSVIIRLPAMVVLACSFLMAGCEDKPQSTTFGQPAQTKQFSQATEISGTAGTGKSLLKSGKLVISDTNDHTIAETVLENGHFKIVIPAQTALPLLLNVSTESHPEKLTAVAIDPSITHYFIDPSTTAIARAAKAMGGYTRTNLIRAAEDTTHAPDANKTTTGWRGDPTTQYGGWH